MPEAPAAAGNVEDMDRTDCCLETTKARRVKGSTRTDDDDDDDDRARRSTRLVVIVMYKDKNYLLMIGNCKIFFVLVVG